MKGWRCNNCGHIHEATEDLAELSFVWLDPRTSKVSCENCGTYTIQRVYEVDENGMPTSGEFLVIKAENRIRKGRRSEQEEK